MQLLVLHDNIRVCSDERSRNFLRDGRKRKSVILKKFDLKTLYVAMTSAIKNKVAGKVIEMKDLCGVEVADPYGQSYNAYLDCAKLIDKACENLTEKLIKIGGEK